MVLLPILDPPEVRPPEVPVTQPERWRDVERIFDAVVGVPDQERGAVLDAQCAGDTELRRQVEALLRADRAAGRFLESTIALAAALTAGLRKRPPPGDAP